MVKTGALCYWWEGFCLACAGTVDTEFSQAYYRSTLLVDGRETDDSAPQAKCKCRHPQCLTLGEIVRNPLLFADFSIKYKAVNNHLPIPKEDNCS